MKAMILAAGLGTRLQPLTNDRPKALVEVAGRALLEITILRLKEFGVREVIVNVHHFADMVVEFLKKHDNFGIRIEVSREDDLLDTGGGLKKAGWFFTEQVQGFDKKDQPFILHNVDVISTIDLGAMVKFHQERQALATLAVQERKTSRYLQFDQNMRLCGRLGAGESPVPTQALRPLAFSGVHVISPRIFERMTEESAFSIITTYLRLAAEGENILGFRADEYYWRDLGRVESVSRAEEESAKGLFA